MIAYYTLTVKLDKFLLILSLEVTSQLNRTIKRTNDDKNKC